MRLLFNNFLGIRNANWIDYQEAIVQLKRHGTFPPDLERRVRELYELLGPNRSRLTEEDLGSLR